MVTLSVIIATVCNDGLMNSLASVVPQLKHGDEILLVRRDNAPFGNATRTEAVRRCAGSHIMFLDDDDVYTPTALEGVRQAVSKDPNRVHIFSVRLHDGRVVPLEKTFAFRKVGGLMAVVPNVEGQLGVWEWPEGQAPETTGRRPGGGFCFMSSTLALRGETEPIFHDFIIADVGPNRPKPPRKKRR